MKTPPQSTYIQPKEIEELEEAKYENRRKAIAMLEEAGATEFACAAASREKPAKVIRRMTEIRLEEEKKHSFQQPRTNPTPKSAIRSDATIKLNTAAILREKKLCEQVEKEQMKIIEELEGGGFSDAQYKKWKIAADQAKAEGKKLSNYFK